MGKCFPPACPGPSAETHNTLCTDSPTYLSVSPFDAEPRVLSVLPTVHFYSVSQIEVLEMGPMALLECECALILYGRLTQSGHCVAVSFMK